MALSRNNIKNLNGLDAVGDTLEQLWISNNNIEKLKGVHVLKKLKVLFMANNTVKVRWILTKKWVFFIFQDWGEFNKLADLPQLVDLSFVGNPLQTKHQEEGDWMERVGKGRGQKLQLYNYVYFCTHFCLLNPKMKRYLD